MKEKGIINRIVDVIYRHTTNYHIVVSWVSSKVGVDVVHSDWSVLCVAFLLSGFSRLC